MKLAITLCSSKLYLAIIPSVVQRIIAAAPHHESLVLIYISDEAPESKGMGKGIKELLPSQWQYVHRAIPLDLNKAEEKYKIPSQLIIATLQSEAFAQARRLGCDQVWNVEADVLVPPDSLRMMEWALQMPNADGSPFYDVAMVTYPNGLFLGGYGDPAHPIAEDFLPEERALPDELKQEYEAFKKEETEFIKEKKIPPKEWQEKVASLMKKVRECPPGGNVFEMNAKHGWRRRGWLENAYPGIGHGAIVPTDWIGTGCVLLSKKALALATFEGYTGEGTQDLYLCWRRWHPAGLRLCAITHTVCDHVKHELDKNGKHTGKYIHMEASHEQLGEYRGHLRCLSKPWVKI